VAEGLPAISRVDLIHLLEQDGWKIGRKATHGVSLSKAYPSGVRVTVVPTRTRSLPTGTLRAILSVKQTGLGRRGLQRLLETYG